MKLFVLRRLIFFIKYLENCVSEKKFSKKKSCSVFWEKHAVSTRLHTLLRHLIYLPAVVDGFEPRNRKVSNSMHVNCTNAVINRLLRRYRSIAKTLKTDKKLVKLLWIIDQRIHIRLMSSYRLKLASSPLTMDFKFNLNFNNPTYSIRNTLFCTM